LTQQHRSFDTRKNYFHTKMMHFLVLTMAFILANFHYSSNIKYGNAFLVQERHIILHQYQDQGTMIWSLDSMSDIQSTQTTEVTSTKSESISTTSMKAVISNNKTENDPSQSAKNDMAIDEEAGLVGKTRKKKVENDDDDVPQPTANGGYSHTKNTRAKISAGNKGKTPWNKGKPRSPDVKARIAAGVRAKHRQRFLKKLNDMGMTEEEYEVKKEEERRIKEAEQQARRKTNGSYRPTEETKKKISAGNKGKTPWTKGKPRSPDVKARIAAGVRANYRKVFLKKLEDMGLTEEEYNAQNKEEKQIMMVDKRKKISETMKRKWQDPIFREKRLSSIRKSAKSQEKQIIEADHRKNISEAMKRKWQDPSYREKNLSSMRKAAESRKVEESSKKSRISTTGATTKIT